MHPRLRAAAVAIAFIVSGTAAANDAALERVLERWDHDEHADLRGVLVLRDGRRVAERYYSGETADTLHDVRSAGKSVTSLLAGIAFDRGALHALGDPVERYWPQARGTAIGDVAIEDVLTMRSGLAAVDADADSPGREDELDAAADPHAFILSLPRAAAPGSVYRYNSVTAAVAGIVVANATGRRLDAFARECLFAPLGITRWRWAHDAAGDAKGQGNLSLTLRDFAALGELVLDGGRAHGRRVVGRDWIERALAPHVDLAGIDPYADGYGYFWYSKTYTVDGEAVRVSFASGNGGNKIYVVPSRGLVVAITSSAYGKGYGQRRSQDILLAILAATAPSTAAPRARR
ncbi:MAG TPA: serine hydrolase [Dokdonella sp.]